MTSPPPMNAKRERQLLEQLRQGDQAALGELLGAHQKQVYHVCLRMVSNPDDAAELAQDVLLRAVQHIDEFRSGSKVGTWLVRIAMNLSISHLRRRKVRRAASLESEVGGADGGDQARELKQMIADGREPQPHDRVEQDEQVGRLLESVDRLDESLKSVIVLRDFEQMDYQGMAEVLGVPVGTVKSRLFRARLALRMDLSGSAGGEAADGNGTAGAEIQAGANRPADKASKASDG